MAAVYRAQASRLNSSTAVGSYTLTLDAATVSGDVALVAIVADAGVSLVSGLGATWSSVRTGSVGSDSTFLWQGVGCTASNTTITVTLSATDRSDAMAIVIGGAPDVLATAVSAATATGGVADAPAETVTVGGQAVVDFFFVGGGFVSVSYTDTPSAFTTVHASSGAAWYSQGWASAYRITTATGTHYRSLNTGSGASQACVRYSALVGVSTPTVSVTGGITDEESLAGALTVRTYQAVTADVRQETVLAAGLTVASFHHGTTTVEHVLSGALTVATSLSAWAGDDEERTDVPLELTGILDVEPVEDPPPPTDPYIQRTSVTMPTPTLVNGHPDASWVPTVDREDWGRLQLIVNGVDRSRPRGKPFVPLSDANTEPFGDAEAAFAFPGLTEFDDPDAWGLTAFAPIRLRRKDPTGVFHTLYEGDLASVEPDTGQGLVIQCVGAIYRLDLLKKPPDLLVQAVDAGHFIADAINDKRRRYLLNIGHVTPVTTGIPTSGDSGSFRPFLTGFVQDQLAKMGTDDGNQWTLNQRFRVPVLKLKNLSSVHVTVSYGAPGVDVRLSRDFTTATTAVYGTGSDGHCTWMGARFPNLTQGSAPAYPLSPGAVFNPGSGTTGFAPFAAFLRRGQYGDIESDDTYLASDENSVRQFQSRAHVTVDGVVGAQTWEAAFQPGASQGSMAGAYVDSIYELAATRQRRYNAQGADVGVNAAFDPSVPRVEDYIPFGDNVSKRLGRQSATQIVNRHYPAGRTGTVTLTSDPTEMSRFDINAGMNVLIENFAGSSVLAHVSRRDRDWQSGTVTLQVDEKGRDDFTAASIHQRDRDVADLTRRRTHGRSRSLVFNDYGQWLCEDGAGYIPLMNQQGGFWNVQRIAAARQGSIQRISLALGTGLDEHALNRNLSKTPPASIPGAARGCILVTSEPINANTLDGLPGLSTPLTSMPDGTNPWDHNSDELTNYYGMVYAAGGPGAAIGFYPNSDPGDGSSTHLTGRFEDGGSVSFGPNNHYWLWVSIWTPVSCIVGGRIYPGAPV